MRTETITHNSIRASKPVPGRRLPAVSAIIALAAVAGLATVMPGRVSAQTFGDVPRDAFAFSFIETFFASRITSGCGDGNYCPEASVTRAQMAVFLERGIRGSDFSPPPATGNLFLDVGATDFAADFIEQLFLDNITAGCGNSNYCPGATVTRDQMAVFLLRAKYGSGYSPPAAAGIFGDVPVSYWAAGWIEQLAAEGITSGCGGGNYCPNNPVTRAQMAVFMARTFNLPPVPLPPVSITNNLIASTLQVISPDPRIGYPLEVTASVEAVEATENVSVSFVAIDRDREDPRDPFPIGTETIDLVEAGSRAYDFTLDIPSSVEIPGPYFIGAIIDPVNTIAETDEEDNRALTEVTLDPLEFPELPDGKEPVNVFLEKIELDSVVLRLDTTEYEEPALGAQNSDAGGTLTLGAQGAEEPVDVEAFAYLRLTRSDLGGEPPGPGPLFKHTDPDVGSHHVPLYLWNSDEDRYMNAYGVDPVLGNTGVEEWLPIGQIEPQMIEENGDVAISNDVDRRSVHLDIYFPGRLARELEVSVRHLLVFLSDPLEPPPDLSTEEIEALKRFLANLPFSTDPEDPFDEGPALAVLSAAICVEIRPSVSSLVEDRFADDNEICTPVEFDLPPLPPPRPEPIPLPPPDIFEPIYPRPADLVLFNQNYRDNWGGSNFGVGVNFNAFSQVDINGFVAQASGTVPVRLFGVPVNFMDAEGRLQLLPEFAGAPANQTSGLALKLSFAGQQIFNRFEPLPNVTFSGALIPPPVFSQEKKASKTFYPGGVPVTVEGFVRGQIGAIYTLDFQSTTFPVKTSLSLSADTFARLDAGAKALVGIGNFISFGAVGDLVLLRESYKVTTGAELAILHNGFEPNGIVEIEFKPRLNIVNDITGVSGTVFVYAEFPVPSGIKFCGYFKIPCGLRYRNIRENFVLDRFTAYRRMDTLLNETTSIDVVRLADGTVGYYAP